MASDRQMKRRSFLKAAGGTAAVATTTAGCITGTGTETGTAGGVSGSVTYARGNDSGTLDPQATSSGEDAKVIQQMYNQVIEFEPGKTTLKAGLAKEWNLNGTTVSLTLREGAKFHSGEEFTSADFKATYRRFLDESYKHFVGKETRSYYGPYLLSVVNKVKTPDKYTVEIDLSKKHAPMLRNLAVFAFGMISKKAIENDKPLKDNPDGTGAFKFEKWDSGKGQIRLSRNANYWGKKANVQEVVFTEITENSSRAQSLQSGDVDIIDGLDAQTSNTVDNSGKANLVTTPGINTGYIAMNMDRREEFRSKKVRQAMNYAVDTKALVDSVYSGLAVQANQPVPENMAGYNNNVNDYNRDVGKAESLLEEAGYGDGFEIEIATFRNPRTYNPSPGSAAQLVKSNLSDVGISATINTMEFNAFISYIVEGKHDVCFLGWMTDNADPDNFFFALLHPGVEPESGKDWVSFDSEGFNTLNVAAWANPQYMKLVEEAQETYDESTRVQKYKKASKIANEEAPWVFLDHAQELRGVHNRVKNFTIAPISGPFLNRIDLKNK